MAYPIPAICHPDNAAFWEMIIRTVEDEADEKLSFVSLYAPVGRMTFQNHLAYQVAGPLPGSWQKRFHELNPPLPTLSDDEPIVAIGPEGALTPTGKKANGEHRDYSEDEAEKMVRRIPAFPLISIDHTTLNRTEEIGANQEFLQWPAIEDDMMSELCDYYINEEDDSVMIFLNPTEIVYQIRCLLATSFKEVNLEMKKSLQTNAEKILTCCQLILQPFDKINGTIPTADEDKFRKLACAIPLNARRMAKESEGFNAFREKLFEGAEDLDPDQQAIRIVASVIQDWMFTAWMMIQRIHEELS